MVVIKGNSAAAAAMQLLASSTRFQSSVCMNNHVPSLTGGTYFFFLSFFNKAVLEGLKPKPFFNRCS
jgi:hypothetical protein